MVYSCDVQLSECFNCSFILYDDDHDDDDFLFSVHTATKCEHWAAFMYMHIQFETLSCPHYCNFYVFNSSYYFE